MQYAGGFCPKDKVTFWFSLISDQRLGSTLNLFSGAKEKRGNWAVGIHRSLPRVIPEAAQPLSGIQGRGPLHAAPGFRVFAASPLRPE
jgi:hypothetical protein